ncbi:7-cyano-7-deazaguanine synthase, partial [Candidatus Liberibacter asiaticus]
SWALDRFDRVETLSFDYGQRNKVEPECRLCVRKKIVELMPKWKDSLGEDHILPLAILGDISHSSLTKNVAMKIQDNNLPNTFV